MSPEQMLDASLVDQRADVWSLGILLFELLTKECPFGGQSIPQVCAAVLTAPAPVPSERRSDIDRGLDAVVLRCLEKDPKKRYASVAFLAEALRPFAGRPARSVSLGLAETRPVDGPRRGTAGSLAPLLAGAGRRRGRWSPVTTVAVLAMGAAMAWLAFSDAGKYEALLGSERLSEMRLPWDPVLAPGPEGAGLRARADAPAPVLLQLITGERSAPGEAQRVASPLVRPTSDGAPTSDELRLRVERSIRWQREQRRIEGGNAPIVADDPARTGNASIEEHPHDDP
jgi:hypothetical protein